MAQYTAAIRQTDDWWIGWIEEVPGVNAQEKTRPELVEALSECLAEALEMNRADAREAVGEGFEEAAIEA
ncbi:MAG: type II toxin-antitoxin system HicB family antitoxin [Planctomycetota bacterium]